MDSKNQIQKREIKFRARHIKNKFWLQSFQISDCGNYIYECGETYNRDEVELLQYTGLKDKNEKEIFESDVLKIYYEGNQRSYLKKVKWLNDPINKGRWDALDNCVFTSCEVVGNIYEHKHLLD